MAIPDFQTLMRPVLQHLFDGDVHRFRDVIVAMADAYGLTEDERAAKIPSGARVMDNRVGWAVTYLSQAGLAERPKRAHLQITPVGRQALVDHAERIDMKVLEAYPAYLAFKGRTRRAVPDSTLAVTGGEPVAEAASTPEEMLQGAVSQNRAALESQVLDRALALSPTGFEDLVMALLERMAYGRLGTITRTSASGDAGVDGVISQDPLGLDRIYVQAKRYALDRTVDRPRIHEFAGALLGKQGTEASSSRPRDSAQAPEPRPSGSTLASSSSMGRFSRSCSCGTRWASRPRTGQCSTASTRTTLTALADGVVESSLPGMAQAQ